MSFSFKASASHWQICPYAHLVWFFIHFSVAFIPNPGGIFKGDLRLGCYYFFGSPAVASVFHRAFFCSDVNFLYSSTGRYLPWQDLGVNFGCCWPAWFFCWGVREFLCLPHWGFPCPVAVLGASPVCLWYFCGLYVLEGFLSGVFRGLCSPFLFSS